jgi:hypothetical protein
MVTSLGGRSRWIAIGGVALAAVIAACSSSSSVTLPPADGNIAVGTWGGDSAGMIVGDTAMHLHINCTYGDVSGRIPLDVAGRFDVIGSYMLRAYPIAVGPAVPARFTGRQDGANLTVTVTVNDTVQKKTVVLGPVVVTYGKDPRSIPCPICRKPYDTRSRDWPIERWAVWTLKRWGIG